MKVPGQPPQRKPWYLLTGFVLGAMLGLVYAWVISPVQYVDTPPSALRSDAKEQYRVLIALSYGVTGDLTHAKARLSVLDGGGKSDHGMAVDPLPTSAGLLAAQAQRALAEDRPQTEVQALGLLAGALGEKPTPLPSLTLTSLATLPPSQTPPSTATILPSHTPPPPSATPPASTVTDSPALPLPSLSPEPSRTSQPSSTATSAVSAGSTVAATIPIEEEVQLHDATPALFQNPSRTPLPVYEIQSRKLICDPGEEKSLIQIQVKDAAGEGVTGITALINWEGGQDSFTTGLKPEIGRGYADFTMTPGMVYTLRLTESGLPLSGLKAEECTTSRGIKYWGTWLLTFSQGN